MAGNAGAEEVESAYAWVRLLASVALMTLGGAGMYAVAVALPAVQVEFGASRSDASCGTSVSQSVSSLRLRSLSCAPSARPTCAAFSWPALESRHP